MICKHILLIKFLNEPELIFGTQLNGSKYCYVSLTIQLNISFVCPQFKQSISSIWPVDRILSGTTTLGQSGPGSDGN